MSSSGAGNMYFFFSSFYSQKFIKHMPMASALSSTPSIIIYLKCKLCICKISNIRAIESENERCARNSKTNSVTMKISRKIRWQNGLCMKHDSWLLFADFRPSNFAYNILWNMQFLVLKEASAKVSSIGAIWKVHTEKQKKKRRLRPTKKHIAIVWKVFRCQSVFPIATMRKVYEKAIRATYDDTHNARNLLMIQHKIKLVDFLKSLLHVWGCY